MSLNPLAFENDAAFAEAVMANGRANGWTPVEDYLSDRSSEGGSMTQGEAAVNDILQHYGVKGMKWGVRKNRSRVEIGRRRGTGTLKAKGGEGRKPSADAQRAKVYGQISKRSGRQALTNAQLKAYIERMNLEKQAKTLERNTEVQRFIDELLKK